MLSEEDRKRLAEIRARALARAGDETARDVAFLAGLVDHLVRPKVDVSEFPSYLALVNGINQVAYCMRLDRPVERSVCREVHAGNPSVLLSYEVSCLVTDAEFAVRPYVRLRTSAPLDSIERLSKCTISLNVDGEIVLDSFPARLFLGDAEGVAVAGVPFSMKGYLPTSGMPCFYACGLVPPEAQAPNHPGLTIVGPTGFPRITTDSGWVADGEQQLGAIFPNQTRVSLALNGIEGQEPIPIVAGVVSAVFSTKERVLRKQDWSPREP